MKIINIQKMLVVLMVFGFVSMVSAHEQAGAIGRKNSKAGGSDRYEVTCYNDGNGEAHHLIANVSDRRPLNPAKVGIQMILPATGETTALSIDPRDSDSLTSADVEIAGGNGPYQVNIQRIRTPKDKKGVEIYFVVFHCETATGTHTGTFEPVLIQNQ